MEVRLMAKMHKNFRCVMKMRNNKTYFFNSVLSYSLEYIWILKETGFTFPERGGFNNNEFESEETLVFHIWQGR